MSNFEIALKEINDEWLASLPNPEDLPEPKLSKKYLRWERRVIRGKKPVANKVVKIILIAAALLIILSVAALSTDKGKEFILQFFKNSAVYSVEFDSSDLVKDLNVGYIPDSFMLYKDVGFNTLFEKGYKYKEQWFEVKKFNKDSTTDFSLEKNKIEIFKYQDTEYIISDEGSYYIIIWNDGLFQYYVGGVLSREEMIKIAKNVS